MSIPTKTPAAVLIESIMEFIDHFGILNLPNYVPGIYLNLF